MIAKARTGDSMTNNAILNKAFGKTAEGFPDLPQKIGSVQLARLLHGRQRGCSFCLPHGLETSNSKFNKDLRCWKRYRKTQYREAVKRAELRSDTIGDRINAAPLPNA